jgi:glutaconyl-CoA/methylmalonyl-CoA decarboxylase subunit gamma
MKSFKFNIRGNVYEVEIVKLENTLAEVEVNGTTYQVEIETKRTETKTPILVRSAVVKPEGSHIIARNETVRSTVYSVKAPLPGCIMSVFVKEGDKIKRGDKILVYEAMKMENNLLAEKDGIIKTLKVKVGDNVLQGEVLLEIE